MLSRGPEELPIDRKKPETTFIETYGYSQERAIRIIRAYIRALNALDVGFQVGLCLHYYPFATI